MKLFNTFFSFEGRLSRSDFFNVLGIAALLLLGLKGLGIMLLSSDMGVAFLYGILLLGLASLASLWSLAALLTKRLHDLNLTAGHAAFVYGLNLFAIGFAAYNPSLGVALTVFMVGASIWFLLTPGTPGRNRFGAARASRQSVQSSVAEGLHAG
jgi:uncharacterized membrane protein YhaH (DUF805 family)